jgi:translation initiation factor 4B
VDVTAREKVIADRLDKEREATKERVGQHSMSRSNSRQGTDRGAPRSPPVARSGDLSLPPSPHAIQSPTASIRSTFSFAAAAGGKKEGLTEDDETKVNDVTEQLGEVTI